MIPFLDLGAATRELKLEIDAAVARVVTSGWYIGGPEVAAFEQDWAAYCGAKHGVGVGNGLDALHLALKAVGVGPGDEVILASNGSNFSARQGVLLRALQTRLYPSLT